MQTGYFTKLCSSRCGLSEQHNNDIGYAYGLQGADSMNCQHSKMLSNTQAACWQFLGLLVKLEAILGWCFNAGLDVVVMLRH